MSDQITLKEYVDGRFTSLEKTTADALVAATKAVDAALIAADKAVSKSEAERKDWQKASNEWRGAMSDRERDFLTRREFYAMIIASVTVISLLFALKR